MHLLCARPDIQWGLTQVQDLPSQNLQTSKKAGYMQQALKSSVMCFAWELWEDVLWDSYSGSRREFPEEV